MVQLLVFGGVVIVAILVISAVLKVLGIAILVGSWILAGYLAGQLVGVKKDPLTNGILGLVGGIIGSLILTLLGLSGIKDMALVGRIIAGVIGGVILIYAFHLQEDKKKA